MAETNRQFAGLEADLADNFESYPDAEILRSQSGLGVVLGAPGCWVSSDTTRSATRTADAGGTT
ncbi:MAG: hypothetical protein ACRD2W_04260, partial [Acidimicrobiales bacterium]